MVRVVRVVRRTQVDTITEPELPTRADFRGLFEDTASFVDTALESSTNRPTS